MYVPWLSSRGGLCADKGGVSLLAMSSGPRLASLFERHPGCPGPTACRAPMPLLICAVTFKSHNASAPLPFVNTRSSSDYRVSVKLQRPPGNDSGDMQA